MITRVILLLALLLPVGGCSSLSRWEHFYHSAQQAEARNDWKLANELYRQAASDARMFGVDEPRYLPVLEKIAETGHKPESWSDVLRVAKAAGQQSTVLKAYRNLESLGQDQHDYEQVKSLAEGEAAYCAEHYGSDSLEYGDAIGTVAAANEKLGHVHEALSQYASVEKIIAAHPDKDSGFRLAGLAECRARAEDALGKRDDAVRSFRQAIRLYEPDAMSVTLAQRRLVRLLDKYGRRDEAKQLYQEYAKQPSVGIPPPSYQEVIGAAY